MIPLSQSINPFEAELSQRIGKSRPAKLPWRKAVGEKKNGEREDGHEI